MASTTTDRLAGVTAGLSSKAPVRAATTANITLSGAQTIDGVAVVADDRVLVKDQTDGIENGIYDAKSGAWVRSRDFDGTRDVKSGTFVVVASGSANAGTVWRISTADDITIGTTSIAFAKMDVSGATVSAFMVTLLDDADAAAARATLEIGAGSLNNIVEDTTPQLGGPLDTNGQLIQFSEGAAITSASSCDIWGGDDGNTVHIAGATNIDDFATAPKAGAYMWVIFDGVLNVNDSATITVDGNTDFTTAANDMALVYAETTTTFLFKPSRNNGQAVVESGSATFPAGTSMLFQQTAAPTGWTKQTDHNNKVIRLQTGPVTTGGADSFTTIFGAGKATASHTLTTGESAAHTHDVTGVADAAETTRRIGSSQDDDGSPAFTIADAALTKGGGGGHTHNLSNFNLQFVDFIIADKDA